MRADMRADVQNIFKSTPHSKQVMMFSATLAKDIRPVCKKFMNEVRSWRRRPTCSTACAAPCQQHLPAAAGFLQLPAGCLSWQAAA